METLKSFNSIDRSGVFTGHGAYDSDRAFCPVSPDNGDLLLSDDVFTLFAEFIYRKVGIRLNSQKKVLVTSRLSKRIRLLGIKGFYDYYQRVKSDDEELVEMLNCIATNTTHFFRERHHFEYLKKIVMPEILKDRAQERTLRIWSAGCSSGEEPYSIAIAVHEVLKGDISDWKVKILATDISTKVLETASAGVYDHEQLPDSEDQNIINRYFLKGVRSCQGKIRVKDFVKEMVCFKRLNFKEQTYPFKGTFDIIFCRNVMIYFDQQMKRHVLGRFHKYLNDNGHLFLGHSETMQDSEQFFPVFITVYKKKG